MRSLDRLLAKGKRILKYGVYGAVGLAATLLPMKEAMGQDVNSYLNVFAQPDSTNLIYAYGSGDANEDGFLRRDDLEYMKEVKPQNNKSDINGDGTKSDSLDIKLLEDLFSGEINYLPGHFNSFPVDSLREKRNDWTIKMVTIDQTDTIPYISPEFDCGEHAIMNILRLRGYNGTDIPDIYYEYGYDNSQNGESNLPVYYAVFSTPSTPDRPSHATNALYIGPDSTEIDVIDPYQWLFFESLPPGGDRFFDNVRGPTKNTVIGIFGISGFYSRGSPILFPILGWETDSEGNISLMDEHKHPNLVEAPTNLPTIKVDTTAIDTIPPEISITYPENDSTYTSHVTELRYDIYDENPDSSWYSTDGGLTRIVVPWSLDTTITGLKSKQGENMWIVYAKDKETNEASDTVRFSVDTTSNGIEEPTIPSEYSLSQNYPNPFNPRTTIKYSITAREHVSLSVYDIRGKKLETLVNQEQSPGEYKVIFDGKDISSGVYFVRMRAGEDIETEKMLLVK